MERKPSDHASGADRNTESGRISRSGTETGISIDSESTSGGEGPIEPGEHGQPSRGNDKSRRDDAAKRPRR